MMTDCDKASLAEIWVRQSVQGGKTRVSLCNYKLD